MFYILAGLWGVADAVWQTQINGTVNVSKKKSIRGCVTVRLQNYFGTSDAAWQTQINGEYLPYSMTGKYYEYEVA